MRRIKFFFRVFWRSISSPEYYQDIAKAKFSFSLKYLYFLLVLISLVWGIKFSVEAVSYFPKIPAFIDKTKIALKDLYPPHLVLTVKNGELSTNVKEPFFVNPPKEWPEPEEKFVHFIAIDTNAKIEDFEKYKSAVLLTKKYIVFWDDNSGYRIRPIKEIVSNITVDRHYYDNLVSKILPFLDNLSYFVILAILFSVLVWPFLGGVISLLGRLLWLVVASVFVLLIAKIMKKDLGYKKLYQLGMHAVTAPFLIALFFDLIRQPRPFLFTFLIFLAFMSFVLYKYPFSETPNS